MATHLDLQEQEQLDALKAFWKQYGNLVTWALIAALGAFAAWNGYQYWQREQAVKASALFDEVDRAALAGDADKVSRAADDLRGRFPRTAFAQHGALLAAKVQFDKGQADAAKASLRWAAEQGAEAELRSVASLRLAGLLAQAKQYDEALKAVDAAATTGFEGLAADRRGDILALQGKTAEAVAAYRAALQALDAKVEYRRLVDAKLTALGGAATPAAGAASAAAAGATGTTGTTGTTGATGAVAAAAGAGASR